MRLSTTGCAQSASRGCTAPSRSASGAVTTCVGAPTQRHSSVKTQQSPTQRSASRRTTSTSPRCGGTALSSARTSRRRTGLPAPPTMTRASKRVAVLHHVQQRDACRLVRCRVRAGRGVDGTRVDTLPACLWRQNVLLERDMRFVHQSVRRSVQRLRRAWVHRLRWCTCCRGRDMSFRCAVFIDRRPHVHVV